MASASKAPEKKQHTQHKKKSKQKQYRNRKFAVMLSSITNVSLTVCF